MASFYKRNGHWGYRVRVAGHPEVSESGFRTKVEAKAKADVEEGKLRSSGAVQGFGPARTTLATGLLNYAHAVTAYQGGCPQALCKINKYLLGAGLEPLHHKKVAGGREFGLNANGEPDEALQSVRKPLFKLWQGPKSQVFSGAQQAGFAERAANNDVRHAKVQPYRALLARKKVSEFLPADFDTLVHRMREAGYKENTIRQEVAILSGFFTYAINRWNWPMSKNPALAADWPDQESRERVITEAESKRLIEALAECKHEIFVLFVLFALETAMRKNETISTACWCDVDYNKSVLRLPHAKNGRRIVPLSPTALELLKELPSGKQTDRIFKMSDSAVASAWSRLCARANIVDLHIHDLKHESATSWAELLKGDLFLLQKVTGNRSLSSLRVYVNRSSDEAVRAMHALSEPTPARAMRDAVKAAKASGVVHTQSAKGAADACAADGTQAQACASSRPSHKPRRRAVESRVSMSLWRRAVASHQGGTRPAPARPARRSARASESRTKELVNR